MTTRVRFAPAPSGSLHVGNARTALFNWLYARHNGGVMVLRVEDTDRSRVTEESYRAVLEDLRWLGLDWDEGPEVGGAHGPYYQSQKLARYQETVKQLLDKGLAYWDYATPEEIAAERCEHDVRVQAPFHATQVSDIKPRFLHGPRGVAVPMTMPEQARGQRYRGILQMRHHRAL